MAQFFINRPVFAWVLSIVIMLAGAMSIFTLPLEQYPDIAPPRVTINAVYTGASAETVENSVTQIIEQQIKHRTNLDPIANGSFVRITQLDTCRWGIGQRFAEMDRIEQGKNGGNRKQERRDHRQFLGEDFGPYGPLYR